MSLDEPLDEASLKRWLKSVLAGGTLTFHSHAQFRMDERGIPEAECMSALRAGKLADVGFEHGTWRYRMETSRVAVVVVVRSDEEAVILTCWRYP
jgi:hypothetical protein